MWRMDGWGDEEKPGYEGGNKRRWWLEVVRTPRIQQVFPERPHTPPKERDLKTGPHSFPNQRDRHRLAA